MSVNNSWFATKLDDSMPRILVILALAAPIACLIASAFLTPFVDHDALIYGIIARGIFHDGVWPYAYAFDHKPIFLYLAYLPIYLIGPGRHEFQIYSAVLLVVTALIGTGFFVRGRALLLPTLATLAVSTAFTVGFSANSELVFAPLMLLSIGLFRNGRLGNVAASAVVAVLCVMTNYAAILPLAAALTTVAICRAPTPARAAQTLLVYGVAAALFLAGFVLLLILAGMDVGGYLSLQAKFLRSYSTTDRDIASWFKLKLAIAFLALGLTYGWRLAKSRATLDANDHALLVMSLGSALFLLVSHKYFIHYLFVPYVGASLLGMRCLRDAAPARLWLVAAVLVANVFGVYTVARIARGVRAQHYDASFAAPYRALGKRVGNAPVLFMHASIVPAYYSGVRPADALVWPAHARILFGNDEDAYFMRTIGRGPRFIVTGYGWCDDPASLRGACARVARDYGRVAHFAGNTVVEKFPRFQAGYDLFERTMPVTPAAR
jgi:hypothetical protein